MGRAAAGSAERESKGGGDPFDGLASVRQTAKFTAAPAACFFCLALCIRASTSRTFSARCSTLSPSALRSGSIPLAQFFRKCVWHSWCGTSLNTFSTAGTSPVSLSLTTPSTLIPISLIRISSGSRSRWPRNGWRSLHSTVPDSASQPTYTTGERLSNCTPSTISTMPPCATNRATRASWLRLTSHRARYARSSSPTWLWSTLTSRSQRSRPICRSDCF